VLAATKAAEGGVVQTTVFAHEVTHGEKPSGQTAALADYVKWHEETEAAQHEHGLTTMIYDEEADPPKAGTWIHYDAFFGTLTLHAEDSDGVCFEHWTTQCLNKNTAEHAAQKFKYLLDEYSKYEAVEVFKEWWSEANGA
jgi:hypothetical protein